MTTSYRTCPLCEATCGLEITHEEGRVVRIRGDRDDVFSHGFICPKGSTLKQLQESRAKATGRGAERVVQVMEDHMRATVEHGPLRAFIENEPDAAFRILWSKQGVVQRRLIDTTRGLMEEAVDAGELEVRLDTHDLAYVIVRIGESFCWREFITGEEPDVAKAAEVIRMLLT